MLTVIQERPATRELSWLTKKTLGRIQEDETRSKHMQSRNARGILASELREGGSEAPQKAVPAPHD